MDTNKTAFIPSNSVTAPPSPTFFVEIYSSGYQMEYFLGEKGLDRPIYNYLNGFDSYFSFKESNGPIIFNKLLVFCKKNPIKY